MKITIYDPSPPNSQKFVFCKFYKILLPNPVNESKILKHYSVFFYYDWAKTH